uniref:Alternative protein TMPRSS7 n=1 Tax=Homo sapiens TaxID=9606 RepID=L8E7F2_HUMAN|nr:alternative protein TMPRSS7 [Homo sapiens]
MALSSVMASGTVRMAGMSKTALKVFHATTELLSVAMIFALGNKMQNVMGQWIVQMEVMKKAAPAAGVPPPFTASSEAQTPWRGVGRGRSASTLLDLPTVVPQSSPGSGFFLQPTVFMETGCQIPHHGLHTSGCMFRGMPSLSPR